MYGNEREVGEGIKKSGGSSVMSFRRSISWRLMFTSRSGTFRRK